jgi:ABC-type glycerol-3-phosphate transport system substrate-binding protein
MARFAVEDHQEESQMSQRLSPSRPVPRVSRRSFLRRAAGASLAVGAPGLLSACGGGGSSAGKSKVRLWTWYTQQRDQFPKLIDEFHRAHPNITVENRLFGDTNSYLPALQTAVASGDVPEIFGPHVLAIQYGKNGVSADLRKELGASFLSDFFDSANAEYSVGDKQYALGWMAQTFGIFYNPEIFDRAKVNVPETWDDLIAAAVKLRAKANVIPCILANNPGTNGADFLLPLITQATDDPKLVINLDQQVNGARWDSKPVVDALTMVDKLRKANVFGSGVNGLQTNQGETAFYTGKGSMLFMGSWVPQDFQQNAPASFLKTYKVMQTPAWAPGRKHWCGNQAGAGLAVANNSKNKEAALEFIKFIYEPSRYAKVMNESASMPSTKTAGERVSDPVLKEMTSWLLKGNGAPHILFGQGSSDAVASNLAALLGGRTSPASAASAMQKAVNQARKR